MGFDEAALEYLVCPVCHARLKMADGQIECLGCGRRYPMVDGLPVLIGSRAVLPEA